MDAWGSLHATAAENGGWLNTRHVRELGIAPSTFHRRATVEGWDRHARGVWSPPGTDTGRRATLSAALAGCGDDALVTGREGLWLHGLDLRPQGRPRLVVPMAKHAARHLAGGVKLISSRTLREADATTRRRLPTARPGRCLVDLVIPPTPALRDVRDLLITALQARLLTTEDVVAAVTRARGVPGLPVLRRALTDVLDLSADSPFSDRVHRRLRRSGLHPDPAPAEVDTAGRVLHPDITFTGPRLAIEVDSLAFHGTQRAVMVDGRKDRAYREASWEPFRIGWLEYERHWAGFVGDLRRAGAT